MMNSKLSNTDYYIVFESILTIGFGFILFIFLLEFIFRHMEPNQEALESAIQKITYAALRYDRNKDSVFLKVTGIR